MFNHRRLMTVAAAAAALMLVSADLADARAGRGGSFGSRGARTFQAPQATPTAPRAAPIERSMTQPGASSTAAQRGAAGAAAQPRRGLFGGGFAGGLMGGLLGAGLFGLLFGSGLFGGLGGLSSILGLLLQIGLIFIAVRLVMGWWRRRQSGAQPAMAGGRPTPGMAPPMERAAHAGPLGSAQPLNEPELTEADQNAFETALREIQQAYGREDLTALRSRVTPEMLSIFSEEFTDNASRGVINEIGNVVLLQGDLSETWREGNTDYATVAMRFETTDALVERESGRVLEGSRTEPVQATEIWTFRRVTGGRWLLSAIQQA